MNGLKSIFRERCINVSEFSKKIGVPRTTLYNALNNNVKVGRMGIDLYLKICDGLNEDPRKLYDEINKREMEERAKYHHVMMVRDGERHD